MSIEHDIAKAVLGRLCIDTPMGRATGSTAVVVEDGALDPVLDLVRAALVRALTAQAWGVAIAQHDSWWNDEADANLIRKFVDDTNSQDIADLPAPADLADELLR